MWYLHFISQGEILQFCFSTNRELMNYLYIIKDYHIKLSLHHKRFPKFSSNETWQVCSRISAWKKKIKQNWQMVVYQYEYLINLIKIVEERTWREKILPVSRKIEPWNRTISSLQMTIFLYLYYFCTCWRRKKCSAIGIKLFPPCAIFY